MFEHGEKDEILCVLLLLRFVEQTTFTTAFRALFANSIYVNSLFEVGCSLSFGFAHNAIQISFVVNQEVCGLFCLVLITATGVYAHTALIVLIVDAMVTSFYCVFIMHFYSRVLHSLSSNTKS